MNDFKYEKAPINIVNEKAIIVDLNGIDVELRTHKNGMINFKFGEKLNVYLSEEELEALTKIFFSFGRAINKIVAFDGCGSGQSNLNKLNTLIENELVLSKEDTSKRCLGAHIGTKLNFTDEIKDTILVFKSTLSELPKVVEFDVIVDGSANNGNNKLKVSLETFIVNMVKEHFKQ